MQVSNLAIFMGSNKEYTHSEPTAVAEWHILNCLASPTFPPMEYALPQNTRLIDTWKSSFAMKVSQHSSYVCWIKPWIETLWAQCSGTQCCLAPPRYLSSVFIQSYTTIAMSKNENIKHEFTPKTTTNKLPVNKTHIAKNNMNLRWLSHGCIWIYILNMQTTKSKIPQIINQYSMILCKFNY